MESALLQEGTYTVLVGERKGSGRGGPRRADTGELLWHELVMRHGGVEVGVITGGSAVAFRSAAEAVRCAIAVQAAQGAGSEWSLGLQAGELPAAAGVEAGPVVQAARLAKLAGAGQVLVTALVRQLVGDERDLRFGEEREVSLPGLAGRMAVHEVHWGERRERALRVVIADDAALVRDGVAALLRDHGVEVAGTASDAVELHEAVAHHRPDVALVDIRMPPTFTDEGLVAAERIRAGFP